MTQLAIEPVIKDQVEIQTLLDQWFKLVQVKKRINNKLFLFLFK
jgi:hypothetical protein